MRANRCSPAQHGLTPVQALTLISRNGGSAAVGSHYSPAGLIPPHTHKGISHVLVKNHQSRHSMYRNYRRIGQLTSKVSSHFLDLLGPFLWGSLPVSRSLCLSIKSAFICFTHHPPQPPFIAMRQRTDTKSLNNSMLSFLHQMLLQKADFVKCCTALPQDFRLYWKKALSIKGSFEGSVVAQCVTHLPAKSKGQMSAGSSPRRSYFSPVSC